MFVFAMILYRPAIPYLEYLARKDYIIENLCINKEEPEKQCNGKCHLEKKVKQTTEGADPEESPIQPSQDEENLLKYMPAVDAFTPLQDVKYEAETLFQLNYSFEFIDLIFHPPMGSSILNVEC